MKKRVFIGLTEISGYYSALADGFLDNGYQVTLVGPESHHFLLPAVGVIADVKGIEKIQQAEQVLDFEFFKQAGDVIPQVTVGTERSGFLICSGAARNDAFRRALNVAALLETSYQCD